MMNGIRRDESQRGGLRALLLFSAPRRVIHTCRKSDLQTHQMRSLPRPLRSRSPSRRRISMTTTHTCWWIPRSQISPGDTSVCLRTEIKEIGEITAAVFTITQHSPGLDFYQPHNAVKTHPVLHHSGQLILLSGCL